MNSYKILVNKQSENVIIQPSISRVLYFLIMGSRISRAYYKNQRNASLKKQQNDQIKSIIVYFISFITSLSFFLFGYLFRPYLHNKNSFGIFFIICLLFFFVKPKQVPATVFVSGGILVLAILFSRIVKIDLIFLNATLILITTAFSSLINYQLSLNPFYQAFLLWVEYESFNIGVALSSTVQKINSSNNPSDTIEEGFVLKLLFSCIGYMAVMLISIGKRLLRIRDQNSKKQISLFNQIFNTILCSIMLIVAFAIKTQAEGQILLNIQTIGATLVILLLLSKTNQLLKTWIFASLILVITYILYFATQNEESLRDWLKLSRIVAINLIVIDGIHKWINSISSGCHKPFVIIFIYFATFYGIKLTSIGLQILQYISYGYILDLLALSAYGGVCLLYNFERKRQYQQISHGLIV